LNIAEESRLQEPSLNKMPLFHTTDAYRWWDIVLSSKIEKTYCRKLKKEVAFLFYGVPAYKLDGEDNLDKELEPNTGNKSNNFLPVCFICDGLDERLIHRVFPFDSGAFIDNKFKGLVDYRMQLKDFELHKSWQSIADFVEYFYNNKIRYCEAKIADVDTGEASSSFWLTYHPRTVWYYLNIVKNRVLIKGLDCRSETIEVSIDSELNLTTDIQACILPDIFLDNNIEQKLYDLSIRYIPYTVSRDRTPSEPDYHTAVLSLAKNYIIDKQR